MLDRHPDNGPQDMDKLPKTIPTGRLDEIRARDDAERIAYTLSGILGETATLRRFASRKALECFCKDGSALHALVKTPVARCMLVNRNVECVDFSEKD